jgi:alpha/beta superfamily hydrolase
LHREEGEGKGYPMKEERVVFTSQTLTIEGLISESQGLKGVVVTHPHPLYGGSMNNNVVESVVQSYGEKGYTTLRFNFRGVGESEGTYSNGTGEQEDVRAAVAYLTQLGTTSIDLAGYSFGAWVNAQCVDVLSHVRRMVMVSPPVNFMDFSFFRLCPRLRLVITGSEDDIAPAGMIEEMLPVWSPDAIFRIVKGADHFYWGKTHEVKTAICGLIDLEG